MKQRTAQSIKKKSTNFFGAFGYFCCALQWCWAALLYFSVIKSATLLIAPRATSHVVQTHLATTPPSSFEMILLAIFTAFMVVVTLYILIKTPTYIAKTGSKVAHRTVERAAPIVLQVQHKKETKKSYMRITVKLMLVVKLVLIIMPIVLAATSGLLEKQSIDYSIAMIASCSLAGFSAIFFAIQYALAGLFHSKLSELW
jgi:hypothetical protein